MKQKIAMIFFLVLMPFLSATTNAVTPYILHDNLRLLAMGDSITAGVGALPMTRGYAHLLYAESSVYPMADTEFANAAIPGAKSIHVLERQLPQAVEVFLPHVVMLTVGGNDLLAIVKEGRLPEVVLGEFAANFDKILAGLCVDLATETIKQGQFLPKIYIANLYTIPNYPVPGMDQVIIAFNQIVQGYVAAYAAQGCQVRLVDIRSAFADRTGLLLFERLNSDPGQIHPTTAGHRVIADAFADAIAAGF